MKDKMNMKVIGIGGMGINFVNFMIASGVKKVEYITIDTDSENSGLSHAEKKIFWILALRNVAGSRLKGWHFNVKISFRNCFWGQIFYF